MSLNIAEWLVTTDPHAAASPRSAEAVLSALRSAVSTAPSSSLSKECKAWLASAAAASGTRKQSGGTSAWVRAEHLLCIAQCFPDSELDVNASALLTEALNLMRPQELLQTRACGLSIVSSLADRLLSAPGAVIPSSGGRKATFVTALPKLMPALLACSKQEHKSSTDGDRLAAASLQCLRSLLHSLRNSMRPYLARIESSIAPLLGSPVTEVRRAAAETLALLPCCADTGTAWQPAVTRAVIEAHCLLRAAWPDHDVDMGPEFATADACEALLSQSNTPRLLPTLAAAAASTPSAAAVAQLLSNHFHGLTALIAALLRGDSSSVAVTVPSALILALVERVFRAVSAAQPWTLGSAALVPPAAGGLSPAALQLAAPALMLSALQLLQSLADLPRSTMTRFAGRYSRALLGALEMAVQQRGLKAEVCRAVAAAIAQYGPACTKMLAVPALPYLLADVRQLWWTQHTAATTLATAAANGTVHDSTNASSSANITQSARPDVAQATRKSSKKALRKANQRAVSQAQQQRSASATANGRSNGVSPTGTPVGSGSDAEGTVSAGIAALRALSSIILHCGSHLPMAARQALETAAHAGISVLARSSTGAGTLLASSNAAKLAVLTLARHLLLQPLADGTRSALVPVTSAACRALKLSTDQALSSAAAEAALVCDALLHPRCAPLHLPPAIAVPGGHALKHADSEGDQLWAVAEATAAAHQEQQQRNRGYDDMDHERDSDALSDAEHEQVQTDASSAAQATPGSPATNGLGTQDSLTAAVTTTSATAVKALQSDTAVDEVAGTSQARKRDAQAMAAATAAPGSSGADAHPVGVPMAKRAKAESEHTAIAPPTTAIKQQTTPAVVPKQQATANAAYQQKAGAESSDSDFPELVDADPDSSDED